MAAAAGTYDQYCHGSRVSLSVKEESHNPQQHLMGTLTHSGLLGLQIWLTKLKENQFNHKIKMVSLYQGTELIWALA